MMALALCALLSGCAFTVDAPSNTAPSAAPEAAKGSGETSGLNETAEPEAAAAPTQRAEYERMDMRQAQALMERETDYILLDVRRNDEYESGHIPGAVCLPNEEIGGEAPEELPDLNQLILVYCRSGNRSRQAADKLVKLGYTRVVEIGGILDWDGEIER